jgi:hypothetical protein
LDDVLRVIRNAFAFPDLPGAKALFEYAPGDISIGLDPTVAERLHPAIWNSFEQWPPMSLGDQGLDELAEELGYKALNALKFDFGAEIAYSLSLCLDELINPPAAAKEFDEIPIVTYGEPNSRGGDGPDTAIERHGSDWYVVIRDASGDCPAGCITSNLYSFIVGDSGVRRIEQGALDDPLLKRLAETWNR